jgi:transposase
MINKLIEILGIERIDDIPLLWAQVQAMGVSRLIDKHFPQHANWGGELSAGEIIGIWLCFILSEGNHRLSHLQGWAEQRLRLLEALSGKSVRALDFSDDRLAGLLNQLGDLKRWRPFEQELDGELLCVYDLKPHLVRVDSTTGKTYAGVSDDSLFQFGHSKDHRPDLAQVKIGLATLDPLGLPLSTSVVAGNTADDPLYIPEIDCVRAALSQRGLTYVGDKKMAALETRAHLVLGGDYYWCPMGLRQCPAQERERLIAEFFDHRHRPQVVIKPETQAVIGVGFEIALQQRATIKEREIEWTERRVAFRSFERAEVEAAHLAERVAGAHSELLSLNRRKQGKRLLDAEARAQACAEIVKRHRVEGILNWSIETTTEQRQVRAWRDRPARTQQEEQQRVKVELDQEALLKEQQRLGWSFYATNQTVEQCRLKQGVLSYRGQYTIEQGLGRLKGRPLGLLPLFLKIENHVVGLIHLLVIALRALCVAQFAARRKLAEAKVESERQIKGLYEGQKSRAISHPTTEAMLKAFEGISLMVGTDKRGRTVTWLTPLSELQKRIIDLFGFTHDVYLRLVTDFQYLTPK